MHAVAQLREHLARQRATGASFDEAWPAALAAAESAAIVALAPVALSAGLTKREICKLAQISRPTLDGFLEKAGRS